jgi:hypothetical protein
VNPDNTVTLNSSQTIGSTVRLTVPTGVTLVVPNETTLTVNGTLSVADNATVNLTAATAAIEVSGTYELGNGVTGTNDGTVTVKSGGTIHNKVNVKIGGSGTNVVEAGGTVYFSDTVLFVGSEDVDAVFQLGADATFSFDDSGFELDGVATLNTGNNDAKTIFDLNAGAQALTLTAGSTLTVNDEKTLAITRIGDRSGPGVVGAPGARIVVTGILDVSGDSDNSNFYNNAGTTIITSQTATGFNWSANAGGRDVAGWVVDASIGSTVTGRFGDSVILDAETPLSYAETAVTATVKAESGYAIIGWYIDGADVTNKVASGTGNTYEITLDDALSVKTHRLTVRATKGGHTYSQMVEFTVAGGV